MYLKVSQSNKKCQGRDCGILSWPKSSFGFFHNILWGFPGGSDGKESACNAGVPGSILGLRRSPEEGNSNPLQYSCLENSKDRGA